MMFLVSEESREIYAMRAGNKRTNVSGKMQGPPLDNKRSSLSTECPEIEEAVAYPTADKK
jgi:hypothetical protein